MTIEGLGKKFQEARLARGLTLDEAARMTKIRPSRLAEIEADDFSQFPSLAYAKGFLLIYGKFLDVDVTPYMEAFEGSEAVTVDGYSYLQDNPAPEPTRAPIARRPRPRATRPTSDRASLKPLIIGIIVIVAGFTLMRLILNIQRVSSHKPEMVGQPYAEPSANAAASVVPSPTVAPPAQSASPRIAAASPSASTPAPAPSASPRVAAASPSASTPAPAQSASPRVAAASPASSAPSVAPASPPPRASPSASAVAVASPAASSSPRPSPPKSSPAASAIAATSSSPAVATTSPSAASPAAKEPEVRKAEPVKAEDLAKAAATEAAGPNRVAIRPLKKTYVKVVVDNEAVRPAFERWISPSDGTVEFRGQKIAVRVLDRDAVQIKKNGKTLASGDADVTIE
jgi:cytoskeletal protein RodZ